MGLRIRFAPEGTAMLRVVLATGVSIHDGLSRALNPCRIVTHPKAATPATPAEMIDRKRERFLMRFHLYWGLAPIPNGMLTSRTGWSIPPGCEGASRPSVSM